MFKNREDKIRTMFRFVSRLYTKLIKKAKFPQKASKFFNFATSYHRMIDNHIQKSE